MINLLTRAEIAYILGISDQDIPYDVVEWGESEVKKLTGKAYEELTTFRIFKLQNGSQSYLNLPHTYVTEIIKVERSSDNGDSWQEIEASTYYCYQEEGLLVFDDLLSTRYLYKVSYKHGAEDVDPLEKKLHFLIVFQHLIKYKGELFTNNTEVKGEKIGDYSINYNVAAVRSKPNLIQEDIENIRRMIAGDGYSYGTL